MTDQSNIQAYHSAIVQAKIMSDKGILDENDIVSIEDKLAQKYGLKFGSLFREIDLINFSLRGKMLHIKEVI